MKKETPKTNKKTFLGLVGESTLLNQAEPYRVSLWLLAAILPYTEFENGAMWMSIEMRIAGNQILVKSFEPLDQDMHET